MNRKEYKNRLEEHCTAFEATPSPRIVGMFGYESAYLDRDAQKELRKDVKERVGQGHMKVPNTNGKATWYVDENGEKVLRSYYTDVAKLFHVGDFIVLEKLWYGYSVTTMNHINAFLNEFGCSPISKHEWVMLDDRERIVVGTTW